MCSNVTGSSLDDWRWLVGGQAASWLAQVSQRDQPLVALTARLRQHLSAGRVHLVLDLIDLRARAAVKFDRASEMFFTRKGLQQATDQQIAAYKSQRFSTGAAVADLCCGLGGDLLGLAQRADVVAVDKDALAGLLAQSNCRVYGLRPVEFCLADVAQFPLADFSAWHIDPDRRPEGRRTTRVELHQPGLEVMDRMLAHAPDAAVKLAPAAHVPRHWAEAAELEWIGHRRQCQQLVVWFGVLAGRPGQAVATVLSRAGAYSVTGDRDLEFCVSRQPGRYVFDPHPAVLAAHLVGALADQCGLSSLSRDVSYLTGDRPVCNPALSAFEVIDVMPWDIKRWKTLLRHRGCGQLEVKKRGLPDDPETIRRRLRTTGPRRATLILTRVDGRATALLTRRCDLKKKV